MPRIAHVISTPSGVGGAERVVAALVRESATRGWDSFVLNPFADDPDRADLAEICEPATYAGYRCQSWREVPGLRRWLGASLDRLQPDIVHAHLFHAAVATASLGRRRRHHSVLTHHHGDHLVYLGRRFQTALDRWAGRRYDVVVAISDAMRRFLITRYGYPESRIRLIRNGWEGSPAPHVGGGPNPRVVSVANFRHQKGHPVLLEAFASVHRARPEARLVLVGEGELQPEITHTIARFGLQDAVDLRGRVTDVWEELAQADVFALASLYEPLGIAVMEAMAAGLPVVSTRVGGIPELVASGTTGVLVEPGDTDTMARELTRLLSDPSRRRALGEAGRQAAEKMKAERTVDAYFRLYEELAETKPDSPRGTSI
jgi:glycosyltransferase involved in cell wall biosynthesis